MSSRTNPFEFSTGSGKLEKPVMAVSLVVLAVLAAIIIGRMGLIIGFMLIALPFGFAFLTALFKYPIVGFYTAVIFAFLLLGLGRYLTSLPVGMGMDGILVLTYVALIFNRFYEKVNWKPAIKDITFLALLWFGYSLLQAVNPEMRSMSAYIGGVRGISLYMLLTIPLALILIDSRKKLEIFFLIWGTFSILASMKGLLQMTFGVDPWEKAWLDGGGAVTHMIFGKLRIFSFMSDAGQFGANQAYSAVVAGILFLSEKSKKKKLFYLTVAFLGIIGMFISGTRGAISVPLAGFMLYFILRKNKAVMMGGIVMMILVFCFFKFTTIGQGNDQIRRMRTAFDPKDASLQVRLENQKKLKTYLASRPMGGGIGHAGVKAQRFLPNAFLSNVATDSWYVLIWAEQGIIGLILHLFILFYVLIKSSYLILFRIRDPDLRQKMMALTAGMFGIMVASYGNAVLGTLPTALLIYTSMALMCNAKSMDFVEENSTKTNSILHLSINKSLSK